MNQSANFPCIKRYREGLRDLIERPADFFLTANYNQPNVSVVRGRYKLQHLHACMDRAMLGKRWQMRPCGERIFFIAVPEIANGKLHHHIVLRVPKWDDKAHFRAEIPRLFAKKIAPGGSLDVQALTGEHGQRRVAEYPTKAALIGEFVISSEFIGQSFQARGDASALQSRWPARRPHKRRSGHRIPGGVPDGLDKRHRHHQQHRRQYPSGASGDSRDRQATAI